ncbi:hypothetical protein K492DRAFT_203184 [Lichtheimia hyalospora FSU 10163]|nr:hypothetical protein K492DRAFT_203184 [Lichtheimia hyalospora FSU 10163]
MTITNDPTPFLPDVSTQGGYLLENGALAVATALPQPPLSTLPSQLPVVAAAEENDTAENQDKQVPTPPPEQSQTNQQQQHSPSVERKRKSVSSAGLDSHRVAWSEEEDKRLLMGIEKCSYGRWKQIAEIVKTRNALQCKNRARHRYSSNGSSRAYNGRQVQEPAVAPSVQVIPPAETTHTDQHIEQDDQQQDTDSTQEQVEQLVPQQQQEQEVILEENEITDGERIHLAEWFQQKNRIKTPERYLGIRNYIIQQWNANKPNYVNKTEARRGLINGGDVNAIGRIHDYLTEARVINVNCIQQKIRKAPTRKRQTRYYEYISEEEDLDDDGGYMPANKRKQRLEDEYDDTSQSTNRTRARPKRTIKPRKQFDMDDDDDQFRLVSLHEYEDGLVPQFNIEINNDAVLVMDFHAHTRHTEIIGVLGGNFRFDDHGFPTLFVECAYPCKVIRSSGIECEMDPVSVSRARDELAAQDLTVIGWYHSHPTFEPIPSVCDLFYQLQQQTHCARLPQANDIDPFIGAIVNPFDAKTHLDMPSQIRYFHVRREWEDPTEDGGPHPAFALWPTIKQSTQQDVPEENVTRHINRLVQEFLGATDTDNIQGRLDEIVNSVIHNTADILPSRVEFLESIRRILG